MERMTDHQPMEAWIRRDPKEIKKKSSKEREEGIWDRERREAIRERMNWME